MAELPRIQCPVCKRPIAAMGVKDPRWGRGLLYRHDQLDERKTLDGRYLSCKGSLTEVELEGRPYQLEIHEEVSQEPDTLF